MDSILCFINTWIIIIITYRKVQPEGVHPDGSTPGGTVQVGRRVQNLGKVSILSVFTWLPFYPCLSAFLPLLHCSSALLVIWLTCPEQAWKNSEYVTWGDCVMDKKLKIKSKNYLCFYQQKPTQTNKNAATPFKNVFPSNTCIMCMQVLFLFTAHTFVCVHDFCALFVQRKTYI